MNVPAYLERIGYHGPLSPTAETLRRLHVAHLFAVPFENLSIRWGEPIVLDDEALFEKVVTRRRGGFCYELNGLFAALLRALGFEVTMLSAGVGRSAGEFSPDYDHMALLVTLEDRWLADVGFGDSFREPLRLDERGEQGEGGLAYRVEEAGDGRLILSRREEGGPGSLNTASAWSRTSTATTPICATSTRPRLSPTSPRTASARWRRRTDA
jgi:N-hydroxyarylamine O-acetyltransferase